MRLFSVRGPWHGTRITGGMTNAHVLQWELYGAGTHVAFSALREESGYGLQVRRDNALVVSAVAADGPALLRKSSGLRDHLMRLGFASSPDEGYEQLVGGLCSGAAGPFHCEMVAALL
jgi:hypothetical protein